MAAPTYMVLKTNIMNNLKLYGVRFVQQEATRTVYGIAQEESHS